jgi:hypothetical protein
MICHQEEDIVDNNNNIKNNDNNNNIKNNDNNYY